MILTALGPGLANLPTWQERTLRGMSFDDYGKTPRIGFCQYPYQSQRRLKHTKIELEISIPPNILELTSCDLFIS